MQRNMRLVLVAGWILFWLLMLAVEVQDYARDDGERLWEPLVWQMSAFLTSSAMVWLHARYFPFGQAGIATPLRWFWERMRWLPVICVVCISGTFALRHLAYFLLGATYSHEPWGEVYFYESIKLALYFGLFSTIWFGILSYANMLEQTERAERSSAQIRQVQLQRLTAQMQPHFLFNALNTISSLMQVDVARADATLSQLAELLRSTLDLGEQFEVSLQVEDKLLRAYAGLMAERFSDRVEIQWQIGDDTLGCMVPVMSLQPLLENVFKHTVERRSATTRILISARRAGDQLTLLVEDDSGQLTAASPAGLGIRNLRERLATLYGPAGSLQLSQLSPAGVRAELVIPCAS